MGPLPFNLEFFTECQDMRQLLAYLDAPPDTGEDGDTRSFSASEEGHGKREALDEQDRDRGSSGSVGDQAEGGSCSREGGDAAGVEEGEGEEDGGGGISARRRGGKNERFHKMTEEICDVVDSYGLVCYYPLNIQVRLVTLHDNPSWAPFQTRRVPPLTTRGKNAYAASASRKGTGTVRVLFIAENQ